MKKVLCLLIATVMCLSLLAPVSGAVFDDIADPELQASVSLLQNLGLISGYPDGSFRPGGSLTRAEFCTMAVMLSGVQDISAYEGFTIFPDVRANHWARGYINAAVRALRVVTGFPDGTFKPDMPISYAQAVTALMRLLGYTDGDVGLTWPHGYMTRASQIGLTKGIDLGFNEDISRGHAAQLLYNALFTPGKNGLKFSDMLGFMEQKVIILSQDGTGPDGKSRGLITIGGSGFYQYRTAFTIIDGSQGTLLVDGEGYALSWTPENQTVREIRAREVGPMSVTSSDGGRINNIPSDALVYINGVATNWINCWIDIPSGTALKFFFSAAGAIDYVFIDLSGDNYSGVLKILTSEPMGGRNPLPSLGIYVDARVFKNGVRVPYTNLRIYDVLLYNEDTRTVYASDFRITGIYENALPSREAPDEVITLGGRVFKLLPEVRVKLAERKIGEKLTFMFTSDGRVADVRSTGEDAYQPGIVKGDRSVELYNGITISGNETLPASFRPGTPVLACMPGAGKISVKAVSSQVGAELDLAGMMFGEAAITPYTIFYDLSGVGGNAVQVDLTSLPNTVPASGVISVGYEPGGRANLIILNNVTGDALFYGFTTIERGRFEINEVIDEFGDVHYIESPLPNLAHIETYYGKFTFEDTRSLARDSGEDAFGLAVGTNGNVIGNRACTRINNIRRSDFTGNAVMVSGALRPIPEGLLVYFVSTGAYIPVNEARFYSNNFSVYLDKPAAEGGKVRFIIAY